MRSGKHFYFNFLYYILYCKSIVFLCQRWIIKVIIITCNKTNLYDNNDDDTNNNNNYKHLSSV